MFDGWDLWRLYFFVVARSGDVNGDAEGADVPGFRRRVVARLDFIRLFGGLRTFLLDLGPFMTCRLSTALHRLIGVAAILFVFRGRVTRVMRHTERFGVYDHWRAASERNRVEAGCSKRFEAVRRFMRVLATPRYVAVRCVFMLCGEHEGLYMLAVSAGARCVLARVVLALYCSPCVVTRADEWLLLCRHGRPFCRLVRVVSHIFRGCVPVLAFWIV